MRRRHCQVLALQLLGKRVGEGSDCYVPVTEAMSPCGRRVVRRLWRRRETACGHAGTTSTSQMGPEARERRASAVSNAQSSASARAT